KPTLPGCPGKPASRHWPPCVIAGRASIAETIEQVYVFNGLGERGPRPQINRLSQISGLGGADYDDRHAPERRLRFHLPDKLKAIDFRHADVGNHEVRRVRRSQQKSFVAIGSDDDFVSFKLKQ